MKKILLFLFLFLNTSSYADDSYMPKVLYPIAFADGAILPNIYGAQLKSYADKKIDMDNPQALEITGMDFENLNTGKIAHASTCNEYWTYTKKGWDVAGGTFGLTMRGFFRQTCGTLSFLMKARPSQHSNFLVSYLGSDLSKLPAAMGEISTPNIHPSYEEVADFKAGLDEDAKIIFDKNELHVESSSDNMWFTPMAKGDFNQDGWEDLLINYTYTVKGASYRKYGNFCLERVDKEKIKMLDCVDDSIFGLINQYKKHN